MKKALLFVAIGAILSLSTKTYASGDNSPGKEVILKASEVMPVYALKIQPSYIDCFAAEQSDMKVGSVEAIKSGSAFTLGIPSVLIVIDKTIKEGQRPQKLSEFIMPNAKANRYDQLRPDKLKPEYSTAADAKSINLYRADVSERTWKDIHRRS